MQLIKVLINEDVTAAKGFVDDSGADNVIEHCLGYLKSLEEYRGQLLVLVNLPESAIKARSAFSREMVSQARAAIEAAVEITLSESKRIQALLSSFTSISIYEAADTLNTFRYEGSNNWEADPVGLKYSNGFNKGFIPTVEALEVASRLRREAYALLRRGTA